MKKLIFQYFFAYFRPQLLLFLLLLERSQLGEFKRPMTNHELLNDVLMCCRRGKEEWRNGDCDKLTFDDQNDSEECRIAVKVCCESKKEEMECEKGLSFLRRNGNCSGVLERSSKDCCLACRLGRIFTEKNIPCGKLGVSFGSFSGVSFTSCCKESQAHVVCPMGFAYNSALNVCDDVDECKIGSHDCETFNGTCLNRIGDYICAHSTGSQNNTLVCQPGFKFILDSCTDVNECDEGSYDCTSDERCINTEGGYLCDKKTSPCPIGYELNEFGICSDINECQRGDNSCLDSQRCDNTLGSFTCVRYTTCGTGYTLNYKSGTCEDTDECALKADNCGQIGPGFVCRNIQGSFRCERINCAIHEVWSEEEEMCITHFCLPGYKASWGSCLDSNECEESNPCLTGQRCVNTLGSFECINVCSSGFKLEESTRSCEDVDECALGLGVCPYGQICLNSQGSYICSCMKGFEKDESTGICADVNECLTSHPCESPESLCQNSQGSYRCLCKQGFKQVGLVCQDINECDDMSGICEQVCSNTWGSFRCHCSSGYKLDSDARSCRDVDECRVYENLCVGNCINVPGSYTCSCPEGYILSSNGRSCEDIDECESNPCRGGHQLCFNTKGGYKCTDIACPSGYAEDPDNPKRCKSTSGRCSSGDSSCPPLSLSQNFLSLTHNFPLPENGINLFEMQSAKHPTLSTQFTLSLKAVRSSKDVEPGDLSYFKLRKRPFRAILSLIKPLQGSQDIVLELRMEMYQVGKFAGAASAYLHIFVTPHSF